MTVAQVEPSTTKAEAPATAAVTEPAQAAIPPKTEAGQGKPADKPAAASETKEAAPAKSPVPEKYEFKASSGEVFDPEVSKDFSEFARKQGLSQEAAQTAISSAEKLITQQQAKAYTATVERWAAEAKADKDIGGDKLTENLSFAEKALAAFGTPGLLKLLKPPSEGGAGYGNHRDVIATFAAIGQRISADGFVQGKSAAPAAKSPEQAFYDKSNMN